MKIKIILPSILLLTGITMTSCDSCNKKHDPDPAVTHTDTTAVQANADTTDVAVASDAASPSTTSATSSASGNTRPNATSKSSTKTDDKSTKGYSAPDGTDAENNDGDQYTRNDQKPRPTGPPIK